MNFDLTSPCNQCPFRTDVAPFLHPARAKEICQAITFEGESFTCHKTIHYHDDGETRLHHRGEQHCAGAMILLAKLRQPNMAMRLAACFGWFDPEKLNLRAPIYPTVGEMVEAYRKADS